MEHNSESPISDTYSIHCFKKSELLVTRLVFHGDKKLTPNFI